MKIKNIFIALLLCSNMFAQTNHIYGELFLKILYVN